MKALLIYAGPKAMAHLAQHGLQPHDVSTIPAAAGGPKGLILGPLDRFIFGQWLPQSSQPVHLVGASIGAWRMATACLNDPVAAFARLERDYIGQHYALLPGEKRPAAARVSALFAANLQAFYGGRLSEVLQHPRYALHVLTSRGRGLLARERGWPTAVGYAAAFACNLVARRALGQWLERVVFSSGAGTDLPTLPFAGHDYPTQHVPLTEANFQAALQASCSIPFVLQAVHDIALAPSGAYWDGGVTDYHLHLDYAGLQKTPDSGAIDACSTSATAQNSMEKKRGSTGSTGLVLYPHFQRHVVPGWLDKHLPWRHGSTPFLDTMVLLAPNPDWVKTLPNGKLPDRGDFTHYGADLAGRMNVWNSAVSACQQLADEFESWLAKPDVHQVLPL
ncbi:MAG: hypothetical protein FD135_4612 [Comamonadaceae bacterium]|nr:MAG: hypothetical protein FD135_4612 [Comamonadaceae bacterium]